MGLGRPLAPNGDCAHELWSVIRTPATTPKQRERTTRLERMMTTLPGKRRVICSEWDHIMQGSPPSRLSQLDSPLSHMRCSRSQTHPFDASRLRARHKTCRSPSTLQAVAISPVRRAESSRLRDYVIPRPGCCATPSSVRRATGDSTETQNNGGRAAAQPEEEAASTGDVEPDMSGSSVVRRWFSAVGTRKQA